MRAPLAKVALFVALMVWVASPLPHGLHGQAANTTSKKKAERYTATAVWPLSPVGLLSQRILLRIDDYTTNEELRKLTRILRRDGPRAFRKQLEKITKGSFGPATGKLERIAFIRSQDVSGGRRIVAITARPLRTQEVRRSDRGLSYLFGWIEIDLDENGTGQGVTYTAKITLDQKSEFTVESFDHQPIQLRNIRRE